jgi:pyruvyltransferase
MKKPLPTLTRLGKDVFSYFLSRIQMGIYQIKGEDAVNAHWFADRPNFGDLLTPFLLKQYGIEPVHAFVKSAQVLVTGSLLNRVPDDYSGYVLGSGLMHETERRLPNAKILALRGALTRDLLNAPKDTPLGDPGLLISRYYKAKASKEYSLGLVPHFVDKDDVRIKAIMARSSRDIHLIDIQLSPLEFVSEMDKCEHVLSSSLHGVIAADALGIPGGWMLLSDNVFGKGFKFHDYASSLNMSIAPNKLSGDESVTGLIKLTRLVNDRVPELQDGLDEAFHALKKALFG